MTVFRLLPVALLVACSMSRGGATREQAAASTFRIDVELITDPSAFDDPGAKESHSGWHGTAWVAGYDRETSHTRLVTAGHVCETAKEIDDEVFGISVGKLKVHSVTYKLIASDNTTFDAGNVLLDDDDNDICVLSHQGWLGWPLPIASSDPEPGARGFYSGAPYGLWGGGLAPVYDLTFEGRGALFGGKCGDNLATLCDKDGLMVAGSMAPGSSGSAIIIDGKVIGVMNLGAPRFPAFGLAVPWNVLRRDLARAEHRLPE